MMSYSRITLLILFILIAGCEKENGGGDSSYASGKGFFIMNEGNFLSGNGSVSYYSYESSGVTNNLFRDINNRPLGDVVNSATIIGDKIYIVVNNSGKIEVVNRSDMRSYGTVSGINSPRFIEMARSNRAYVSSLYSDSLIILDTETLTVGGYINIGKSSEYISLFADKAYVSNWSGGRTVTVIDRADDSIIQVIELSAEPGRVLFDQNGKGWVLCNGGYTNEELPVLYMFDPASGEVIRELSFPRLSDSPSELCINDSGDYLYYLNGDIYCMPVAATELPSEPIIESSGRYFYRMSYDKSADLLLVTDAIDYMQRGFVYAFTHQGTEQFSFLAGIIPGSFCFEDSSD